MHGLYSSITNPNISESILGNKLITNKENTMTLYKCRISVLSSTITIGAQLLDIVFTTEVRVFIVWWVATAVAVIVVPSLPEPTVNDLGGIVFKVNAQVLHSIGASVWVDCSVGVVCTLACSFTGYSS